MKQKVEEIRDMPSLLEYLSQGGRAKYVFFWGHHERRGGLIGKNCFSQWYSAPFIVDGEHYRTAEHFMMAEKAKLFGDHSAKQMILNSRTPAEAKRIGRNIKGFSDEVWITKRFDIVVEANKAKFSQNAELKRFLLATGKRVLVESSPVDKIWGIGLAEDNPMIDSPYKWKGLNLLGFALMEVRKRLQEND